MKKMKMLLPGLALVVLGGCASSVQQMQNEALLPEIDVIQVKENSDEALKLAQQAKLDVDVLSTKITELDNKIILLSEEISSVSAAKIEELENRLSLLVEAYKDLQAQIKAIEAMPVRVVSQAPPKKPPEPATFSPASAINIMSSPEYDMYQQALQIFNKRQYDNAVVLFNELLKNYPSGQYTANAYYWIGECYYSTSDYASAINTFQKVLTFNRSQKVDDAQNKIALSFLKMGQPQEAKAEFKKLVERYPASEFVPRAKQYLKEIM
ncbi:MAG TPA: tol-pal system protein YbgF [Chitinispirillaceae bacterium]|nr:tol-pal system protein YbgF [Chitinispirillaceae bacterium]